MTPRDFGAQAQTALDALARRLRAVGCVFAEEEAALLLDAATGAPHLEQLVRRRETGEPLEHVVGWVGFAGVRLAVGPGVFVPRQRSMLVAHLATRHARRFFAPVVVEVCAGAAPVARIVSDGVRRAEVHASDVDATAVSYAARNLPHAAGVHLGDLLDGLPAGLRGRVAVLAAVTPYAPLRSAPLISRDSLEHEPFRALFGGTDGLDLARRLVDGCRGWLAPEGVLLLELHRSQYDAGASHALRAGLRADRHEGADGQTVVLEVTP